MTTLLKLAGCVAVYFAALMVSGVLVKALGLHTNPPLDNTAASVRMLLAVAAGAVLVAGLYPLARGLAGQMLARVGAMIDFILLALAVNTMIETSAFSSVQDGAKGAEATYYLCLAAAVGGVLGMLFGKKDCPAGLPSGGAVKWILKTMLAWLSWPLIYFLFGMCVAPLALEQYQTIPWLHIPPLGTIIEVQLVRSLIFLASSLPSIALWKGSRRGLFLTLGLAHAAAVGWFGLVQATFFPMVMRVAHTVEITADSFAYAGVLAFLFSGAGGVHVRNDSIAQAGAVRAH